MEKLSQDFIDQIESLNADISLTHNLLATTIQDFDKIITPQSKEYDAHTLYTIYNRQQTFQHVLMDRLSALLKDSEKLTRQAYN